MPNFVTRAQSASDLRESEQSTEDIIDKRFSHDGFPGETYIGIALGSPRDSLLPLLPPAESERYVAQQQKTSRWKSFGSLFGKRGLRRSASTSRGSYSQHEAFRETTPSSTFHPRKNEPGSINNNHTSCAEPPQGYLGETRSFTPHSATTAGNESLRSKLSFKRSNSQRKLIQDRRQPNRERAHTMPLPQGLVDGPKLRINGDSLLQVEIPHVEMERYSVMFGNLLRPPAASSLLVRREAHLEELFVDTAIQDVEPTVSIPIFSDFSCHTPLFAVRIFTMTLYAPRCF